MTDNNQLTLSYNFNERELRMLAKVLRKNQDKIPDDLRYFASTVEKAVYNAMTIDEVEKFYS
jgi:hypothetical protein